MADPLPTTDNEASKMETGKYSNVLPTTDIIDTPLKTPATPITDNSRALSNVTIDVVRDFDWTLSSNKRIIIGTIPYITMVENKLISSNILTSLFTSLFALPDAISSNNVSVDNIRNSVTSLLPDGMVRDAIASSTFSEVLNTVRGASGYASSKVTDIYNALKSQYSKPTNNFRDKLYDAYGMLYLTKPTGAEYIFPYFNSEFANINNSFQDTYQTTPGFDTIADFAKTVSENTKAIPSLVEPGTYIQRPKFYNFESGNAVINFKVTLFNTIRTNSYLKNNNLITGLLLLNMPRRVNKILVDPPCIYEVTIPGKAVYPFCFIKNLTVHHEGVKRIMPIDGVDTIVPDAFTISITLESMVNEVNNLYEPQTGTAGIDLDSREVLNIASLGSSNYLDNVLKGSDNASLDRKVV